MHTNNMYTAWLFNKYFRNVDNMGAAGWALDKNR